jgi:hypothetical protein
MTTYILVVFIVKALSWEVNNNEPLVYCLT